VEEATSPPAKNGFLRHLYIKTMILPRQAQDKHRENAKRDAVCSQVDVAGKYAAGPLAKKLASNEVSEVKWLSCTAATVLAPVLLSL
jgi:hypothetical protein